MLLFPFQRGRFMGFIVFMVSLISLIFDWSLWLLVWLWVLLVCLLVFFVLVELEIHLFDGLYIVSLYSEDYFNGFLRSNAWIHTQEDIDRTGIHWVKIFECPIEKSNRILLFSVWSSQDTTEFLKNKHYPVI